MGPPISAMLKVPDGTQESLLTCWNRGHLISWYKHADQVLLSAAGNYIFLEKNVVLSDLKPEIILDFIIAE